MPSAPNQQTANPFSRGGGGTVFELKVQAGLLVTLLARGHIPLFQNATFCELHLQAEHLDYETDDAILVAKDNAGVQRRQLWSVIRCTPAMEAGVVNSAWTVQDLVEMATA